MIPFIIAGAVGFGIAKLLEKDDNKKFEGGGKAGGDLEKLQDIHEKIREILIENGSEEYGDSIIDEISEAVGISNTNAYYDEDEEYVKPNKVIFKGSASKKDLIKLEEIHEKIREILIENGNEEYGDLVIDQISEVVGIPTTIAYYKDEEFAEGGEVVIYPTDSNGKTFKWINIDDKYQEVISDDISKKMGMVVRVPQGYNLFVLESETQNKKDYHILAQISTETGEIEMIKGKFNSEPSSKYQKYIDDLINKFNFSINKDNYAEGGSPNWKSLGYTFKTEKEAHDFVENMPKEEFDKLGDLTLVFNGEEFILAEITKKKYTKSGKKNTIKDWYIKNYPTDDLGEEINDATFSDLMTALDEGVDVYSVIGVNDSIVRERLFEHLAEINGVEYNYIYDKWLKSDDEYAKGGLAKKRRRIASVQYGRSDRSVDKTRFAKPVGYRYTDEKATQLNKKTYTKPTEAQVKKYLGNGIYKENRKNRSDKDRKVKL